MFNNFKYPGMESMNGLKTYVVKSGDSLYTISKMYGVSIEDLQEVNKLATTMIYPNQVLFIPEVMTSSYITKSGDTLKTIFMNYNLSIPNLNGFESLFELELEPNQQIDSKNGILTYNGESITKILETNNLSAYEFLELNKNNWLKRGSQFKVR